MPIGKIVSSIFGGGSGGDGGASASMAEMLKRLDKVQLPDIEKMRLILEEPELVGQLIAETQGPSALEDVQVDPRLKEQQMRALQMLAERGQQGLTEEDRIAYRQMQDQVAADEQARQASIVASMQQAGMADSGTALAAQLSSSQAAAQRQAQQSAQMAQAALQAKREALSQSGQMAGQMGAQEFAQGAQKASAQDAINQFNLMNRMNVQQQNLSEKQRIRDTKTDLSNQQQMYNKGLYQQQFQNEMAKAGAAGNALQNQAQMQQQAAQARSAGRQAAFGGLLQAGATLGAAALMPAAAPAVMGATSMQGMPSQSSFWQSNPYGGSDEELKKDISKPENKQIKSELKSLLDKLEPYMYNYKDPKKEGEGRRLGVMAQDLEKSSMGKEMVMEDQEGSKRIDLNKVASAALAASSNLIDRVEKLEKKLK